MNINTLTFTSVVAVLAAIAATVLAFIFIVPENKKNRLGKIGSLLHNIFNFKFLIVEKILQAFYIFTTALCITGGIAMIFGFSYYYSSYLDIGYFNWYGGYGILLIIFGPITIRLVYEGLMLVLLLVKNVIQINAKLKSQTEEGKDNPFTISSVADAFKKDNKAADVANEAPKDAE